MITAVTGLNGAGKTAYAGMLLQRYRARGIRIAANINVAGAQHVRSFEQLMQLRDCVFLIDDVTAVASSRQFASLTPEALLFFQTLRHSNVGVIWTAPTFARCDLALRELTLKWIALTGLIRTTRKGGIWANTHLTLVRSGRPVEIADGDPKMPFPTLSLFRPAVAHAVYDSFADIDLFTRRAAWPSRCPECGFGIDYGRGRAAVEPIANEPYAATFYCPRCSTELGSIRRATSQLSGVNPPPPDPADRRTEFVPGDFEKLLFGVDAAD